MTGSQSRWLVAGLAVFVALAALPLVALKRAKQRRESRAPTDSACETAALLWLGMIFDAQREHYATNNRWAESLQDLKAFLPDPDVATGRGWRHTFSIRLAPDDSTWLATAAPVNGGDFVAVGPDGRVMVVHAEIAALGSACTIPPTFMTTIAPGYEE